MTIPSDDRVSSALTGVSPKLERIAACALGLMLALCLAGVARLLTPGTVAGALGFVVGGGLTISGAIVRDALERAGLRGQRN